MQRRKRTVAAKPLSILCEVWYTVGMPRKADKIAKPAQPRSPRSSVSHDAEVGRAARAHSEILDLVLSGELLTGSPLNERQLAEMLGMSRTPVRDALGRLEVESVITRHGKTLTVRQVSVQEIKEVMAIREVLESYAARLAAGRIDPSEIEDLSKRIHAIRDTKDPTADEHWKLDDAVHELVWRGSGNAVLGELVVDLRRRTRMFDIDRVPERFMPGCDEHLALLIALASGDAEAASTAMRSHIRNARQGIFENLINT